MIDTFGAPLLLLVVGVLAGALNVIAGGGSMLTLPVLIFLGLPPTVANGTNRLAILVQNVGASWTFTRKGFTRWDWARWITPPAFAGAVLGAWAAVVIEEAAFQAILALVILTVAVAIILRPPVGGAEDAAVEPPNTPGKRATLIVSFFGIGFYSGFIQIGSGLLTLSILGFLGLDLVRGNAVKVFVILLMSAIAVAIFAVGDKIDWLMGATLATGNFIGGQIGVHLTVLKGQDWVRKAVVLVAIAFAVRLLFTI